MNPYLNIDNYKKAISDPLAGILFLLWVNRYFSQAWEDIIIDWLTHKNKWLYVDIWANHPINGNNTYLLYNKWWRGINIEPNRKMIKKFQSTRSRDINLQIAIGPSNNDLTFYVFNEHQMCTCDIETVKRYQEAWFKIIDKYSVPVWTLERLFDTHALDKEIDVLSVDVEWWDMDVLESNNWDKYKPSYIILETVEYSKDWWKKLNDVFDKYLKDKWYWVIAQTAINTIYKLGIN
jgi:FkbM family methyltransferase